MRTLLYVSESRIDFPREAYQVTDIVNVARARNSRLSVTGALIFTEQSFAQVLEGPAAAVGELMASIERDPRHHRLSVLIDPLAAGRRFSDWSMAYSGPSLYVERHIRPLLDGELEPPEVEAAAERLLRLIEELTLRALDDDTG
ncbi:MAG TPA: BLUF domain-containing protein [Allosphingosinicella sp.]